MKRSNEEFSTTVVEERQEQSEYGLQTSSLQPTLKLGLSVKKAKQGLRATKRLAYELTEYATQQDVLKVLVELERELPLQLHEEVEFALRTLWERLYEEKATAVRVKIISLLGTLARFPGVNTVTVFEDFMKLLPSEKSHKVRAQILHSLLHLGRLYANESKLVQNLISTASQCLKDPYHGVRCQCLDMIGHLSSIDATVKFGAATIGVQSLLASLSHDSDPRVRTSALQALLTLHERGWKLDMSVYEQASAAMNDDYEDVRLVAVKLVWVFSHTHAERTVALRTSDEVRLVDDAFIKICQMVNDLSMKVRTEAAGLLGSLHHVSPRFLEQTLDKKVMSHLKRRKTDHEKQRERHAAGGSQDGFSTGRIWGNAPPQEEMDPEEVSLMSSGACGAFVHGLEDEFLEVRTAAVDSLCELANQSPSFAFMSLDFLVDMFNDEIEAVRLNAINSLRKISHHIELREDQLETVLGVLEDFSWEIREGVRELLCQSHLSTRACLHAAINALLGNLTKYPEDRASIWRCAKFLGEKHQHLAASLVPELLSTHPFFATSEPSVDDPAYVAIVILVFNATVNSPTMIAMFPDHTRRHYGYLRDSQPALVPHLDGMEQPRQLEGNTHADTDSKSIQLFLARTQERIQRICTMDAVAAQQALRVTIQDLHHMRNINKQLAATSECTSLYLQCQLSVLRAQGDKLWEVPAALCSSQGSCLKSLVEGLLTNSYRIEHAFIGLSGQHMLQLKQLRLIAHALQLLMTQRCDSQTTRSLGATLEMWEPFLVRVRAFTSFVSDHDVTVDSFSEAMVSFRSFFESNVTKTSSVAEYLQQVVLSHTVTPLDMGNHLRQATAVLNEPRGGSDNPLCFTAGLTLGVHVDAEFENVCDPSCVRVQVVYPDLKRQLIIPKQSDFHTMTSHKHRLLTTVVLSHSTWSEPCYVELSLVLKYTPDVNEESVTTLDPSTTSRSRDSQNPLKQVKNSTDSLMDGVVGLCAAVQLCILPKQSR